MCGADDGRCRDLMRSKLAGAISEGHDVIL